MLFRSSSVVSLGWFLGLAAGLNSFSSSPTVADDDPFHKTVVPLLDDYCFGCHGYGSSEGGVSLDPDDLTGRLEEDRGHWHRVLRQLRSGLMPPPGEARPTDSEFAELERWILDSGLGLDPERPDPGRVTLRRLNRAEYRNTIRDLLGVSFDADTRFPADDSGEGFDHLADVLTVSPLLLEKYLVAAEEIIARAVPTEPRTPPVTVFPGSGFAPDADDSAVTALEDSGFPLPTEPMELQKSWSAPQAGRYSWKCEGTSLPIARSGPQTYRVFRLRLQVDGETRVDRDVQAQPGRSWSLTAEIELAAGEHRLVIQLEPRGGRTEVAVGQLSLLNVSVTGPLDDPEHWVATPGYERYFPNTPPEGRSEQIALAGQQLQTFASRAFRRPIDEETLTRLVGVAERRWDEGGSYEEGVAQAMMAVLVSPRFLFRQAPVPDGKGDEPAPWVDEFSLATRLSYFLWSSMPDDELLALAAAGKLRESLPGQIERMLADPRHREFYRNFVGQWLQTRGVEQAQVDPASVLAREGRAEEAEQKGIWTPSLQQALREETERTVAYLFREDRDLGELVDADYTFWNAELARYYGEEWPAEAGEGEWRRVDLPAGAWRGGVLTQGSILVVTSNPARTSPVKRGLFILDNLLGMPPGAPPPNIPSLEEAAAGKKGSPPTLRESLALHRENPACSSCHNRMDPLGLALENFNALGQFRDHELDEPIDGRGTLATGETFGDVRELKQIIAQNYRDQLYRCVVEKLLIYALGRSLSWRDIPTVDALVEHLRDRDGHAGELIPAVIASAPFQRIARPHESDSAPTAMGQHEPLRPRSHFEKPMTQTGNQ